MFKINDLCFERYFKLCYTTYKFFVKMETTIKERVILFCRFKNLSIREFEKQCNVSNGYFNNLKNGGIAYNKMLIILESFPELNGDWLATGRGEMLKNDCDGDTITQTVGGDNNGTMIGKSSGKYSGNFAGIPEGTQLQYLMEQNKQLLQQNQKFQEHIDRLLGIIEGMNRGNG